MEGIVDRSNGPIAAAACWAGPTRVEEKSEERERCGWAGVGPGSAGLCFFSFFSFSFSETVFVITFDLELQNESNQF